MKKIIISCILLVFSFATLAQVHIKPSNIKKTELKIKVIKLIQNDEQLWDMEWLNSDEALVSVRVGKLKIYNRLTNSLSNSIKNMPKVAIIGQGGLLAVKKDNNFNQNKIIYFTASVEVTKNKYAVALFKAFLNQRNLSLEKVKKIYQAYPAVAGGRHFGSTLLILEDNTILMTLGDRGIRANAQDFSNPLGSIIRLNNDGTIPKNNPFIDNKGIVNEIYSLGHRNVQGIAIVKGLVYANEHGPYGGDEINLIQAGKNYGWPLISYGREYVTKRSVGKVNKTGFISPLVSWSPSIAPSSMAYYDNNKYPMLKGLLLNSGLTRQNLISYNPKTGIQQSLIGHYGRIRNVSINPNGEIYLLNDNGAILMLKIN